MISDGAIEAALDRVPALSSIVLTVPDACERLERAREVGACSSEVHLGVELLLGDDEAGRRAALETGLGVLKLSEKERADFARRICVDHFPSFREATSALTELYVAGRFALVGASVRFLPRAVRPTPDIVVRRGEIELTLEVHSTSVSDAIRSSETAKTEAFNAWPRHEQSPPASIVGEAQHHPSENGGYVRTLERHYAPLGEGHVGQIVDRLAGKKDGDRQLAGYPNGIQVMSLWHMWGPEISLAEPTTVHHGDDTATTGLFYAATYGKNGDTILSGDEFEGCPRRSRTQTQDGILVRSRHVSAALWLTYDGAASLLRRAVPPTICADALALVREAFSIK
jgi:hypothetical protein